MSLCHGIRGANLRSGRVEGCIYQVWALGMETCYQDPSGAAANFDESSSLRVILCAASVCDGVSERR